MICLRSRTRQQGQDICIKPGRKEFTMCSSSRLERTTTANIGKMMGRLGIDRAYAVLPRYGLSFSSALRACNSCTARAQCAQWMADTRHTTFGPPKFCASADLLWELLCDPAIGHRPQSVQLRAGETCGRSCRTCHRRPNSPSARTLLCSVKAGITLAIASSIKSRALRTMTTHTH